MTADVSRAELAEIYRNNLGIPIREGPINFYELLGLKTFESDPELIQAAARRQSAALRRLLSSDKERAARVVLQQIAKAKSILLDMVAGAVYDEKLRASIRIDSASESSIQPENSNSRWSAASTSSAPKPTVSPPPVPRSSLGISQPQTPKRPSGRTSSTERFPLQLARSLKKNQLILAIAGGSVLGAVVAVILIFTLGGRDDAASDLAARSSAADQGTAQGPAHDSGPVSDEASNLTEESGSSDSRNTHQSDGQGIKIVPSDGSAAEPLENKPADASPRPSPTADGPQQDDSAPAPPPPAAVVDVNPFGGLPAEVSLPAIRTSESVLDTKVKEPLDIGPLQGDGADRMDLSVQAGAANLPSFRQFRLVRSDQAAQDPEWECQLTRIKSPAGEPESDLAKNLEGSAFVVARFFVQQGRLLFVWSDGAVEASAGQLRNAVLELSEGSHHHTMRLRPVERKAPVRLDFDLRTHVVELNGPSLPSDKTLFLELQGVDHFQAAWKQDPLDGRAACGKMVRIQLLDWKGAEIRLKLSIIDDSLQVTIAGYYKLGRKWNPLTTEQVTDTHAKLQNALQRSQKELVKCQRRAGQISSEIRALASRSPRSQHEAMVMNREITQLNRNLKNIHSGIRRHENNIPKNRQVIEQLQALVVLGKKLHNVAELRFRVAAQINEGDYELLSANAADMKNNPAL